jgi:hypothetical protein
MNFKPSAADGQWRSPTPSNIERGLFSHRDTNSGHKSAVTKVVNNESNFTIGYGQND